MQLPKLKTHFSPGCPERDTCPSCAQAVMGMLADGTVRPPPPRKVYSLDEAAAAVEDAQQKSAGGTGKVMLGA